MLRNLMQLAKPNNMEDLEFIKHWISIIDDYIVVKFKQDEFIL